MTEPIINQDFQESLNKAFANRSSDFKSIYSNWAQGTFSAHDISLLIGEAFPAIGGMTDLQLRARLVFNPSQAKVIASLLANVIKAYEEKFGNIVVPETSVVTDFDGKPKAEMLKTEGD